VARALALANRCGGAALALLGVGCGGGVPLLHGAHALAPGSTTSAVGFSSTFTAGAARDAVDAARKSDTSTAQRDDLLIKQGVVAAALNPAVAPFLGMRVGLPGDNEAGLSYTGRFLRLDARHAFESGPWAWSVGLGANTSWSSADTGGDPAAAEVQRRAGSLGFDIPLLVGWRSDAGIVSIWGGARGGTERIGDWSSESNALGLTHWRVGGIAGLSLGFRHIHAAVELETSYHGIRGNFGGTAVNMKGVTLTPAGGLLFSF